MSDVRFFLDERDLNMLLKKQPELGASFLNGRFSIHRELPLGAATLTVIPSMEGPNAVLLIPFDQIQGSLTGPLMGQLTRMLWALLGDQVQKRIAPRLLAAGLAADTLTLEQVTTPEGKKAGCLRISTRRLNEWLRSQPWLGETTLEITGYRFERDGLGVELALSRIPPAPAAPRPEAGPTRLPPAPEY